MRKRSSCLWLLLLFTGVRLFGAPTKIPIVFVDAVKANDIFDLLTYPARLIPTINATLLSEADAIVQKIVTPLGRSVGRGETVLTLRNTDPVYEYAPMRVTSPVAGVVSAIEVTEGSRVQKGTRLGSVTDPTKIKIVIELASSDLAVIGPGMTGDLWLTVSSESLPVKVIGVSPFVDPATGTATAELSLVKGGATKLPPGLVGRVTFKARQHRGVELPDIAVTYRGSNPFVRVVEEGKAKFKPVTLGQTRRGMVEVVKGVGEGEKVIVRTSSFVADGEPVTVQNVEAPKS